jgi:hypothetical protein
MLRPAAVACRAGITGISIQSDRLAWYIVAGRVLWWRRLIANTNFLVRDYLA